MSSHSSKRRKVTLPDFGAPSEADQPSSRNATESSSALSMRALPVTTVPPLTTLCARQFVASIRKLAKDERAWESCHYTLKVIPEGLLLKLFAMLRVSCPNLLNHAFVVAHFMRGRSMTLTSELSHINRNTISSVSGMGEQLYELQLSGLSKYPDSVFASLLAKLPSLRTLVLRGCAKVGPKTADAAAKSCAHLTVLNLNYTSVTPASLVPVVTSCSELQVLKLAGIPNWTDATFAKFISGIPIDLKFSNFRTLKLRQTSLSDTSLGALIVRCPGLKRLDLSFTFVRRISAVIDISNIPPLEKLSITSTQITSPDLLTIIENLPHLKTLSIGALGGGQGSSAAIDNSTAMTLNDATLRALTDILATREAFDSINLVANAKLGMMKGQNSALSDFIARVGRKCKTLNLSRIPSLRSSDFAGLVCDTPGRSPPSIQTLILNHTGVDDNVAPFISSCQLLTTLEVAGTKLSREGLFPIISSCNKLVRLDLTSCRGVSVVDRRHFFELWEDEQSGD